MHPAVQQFIERFEDEAARKGLYRKQLGRSELKFIEHVWGPAFQFNFDGLHAEYPLKDFKGGDRFIDFVYLKSGIRLIIEIDGFTTHARDISPGEFDDHLMRQNDLILSGWMLLRFSAHQVDKRPAICQRQILQAIGHWWTITHGAAASQEADLWSARRRLLVQLALRQNGQLRARDVQTEFRILHRTALKWMAHFVEEGVFTAIKPGIRITGYQVAGYSP